MAITPKQFEQLQARLGGAGGGGGGRPGGGPSFFGSRPAAPPPPEPDYFGGGSFASRHRLRSDSDGQTVSAHVGAWDDPMSGWMGAFALPGKDRANLAGNRGD